MVLRIILGAFYTAMAVGHRAAAPDRTEALDA
jgi:hypothetical protein